jgi:hypothetical protein
MPRPSGGAITAAAFYTALALAMTWPLSRGLTRDLPSDFGDPLLNTWILAWDAEHLLRALSGQLSALGEYWHANIFYPHPLALAYSEHLTLQALMILPVYALTHNPILAYNVVFLSTFVLSAIGMFVFARDLTQSNRAALLAGIAFGFAPYRFGTLPHVQVLSSMWMPWVLCGFHRFFETRRSRPLVAAGMAWTAQNLSCGYYLLFFSPVVVLYAALEITRRGLWSSRAVVGRAVGTMAVVVLATAPFLVPYWQLRQLGFDARSLAETNRFSADVLGYATTDVGMRLWGDVIRAWPKPEGSLFPGLGVLVLAVAGIGAPWWRVGRDAGEAPSPLTTTARGLASLLVVASAVTVALLLGWTLRVGVAGIDIRLRSLDRGLWLVIGLAAALAIVSPRARMVARRWIASPVSPLTLITAFAFAMSLGPQIFAHGRTIETRNVYAFFYDYVPGFDGLRVPARFAMIVALGLAALTGFGAARLLRLRHGTVIVCLAAIVVIAEAWAVPLALNVNSTEYKQSGLAALPDVLPTASTLPAAYRFVRSLPPGSALIELPFGEVAFETRYMFSSTFHWRRLVNGYSGGSPREYGLWAERLKEVFAEPDKAWQAVVDSRATHLIVHEASYAGGRGPRVSQWAAAHDAREVGAFGDDHVFAVPR